MIRIYFPAVRADRLPIDLACALRVGGFEPQRGPEGPESGKNDQLNAQASHYFQVVPLDEADVVVFPYKVQDAPDDARQASLDAKQRNLPCYFLSWGDADEAIELPHGIVLRHSLFSDRRLPHERALAAFCSDPLLELERPASFREKRPTASVGFCGYVGFALARMIYRLMGRTEKSVGLSLRAQVLSALRRCNGIQTDFITRNAYWAGAVNRKKVNPRVKFQARPQFLENLVGNDYTVCIRGAGNFSYRFYETLAAGRIPLLIDTKCVFPFDDKIDWKSHCVWVEEQDINRAGEILQRFHAALSEREFLDLQKRNRRLWEEWLSPLGFYRKLLEGREASQ